MSRIIDIFEQYLDGNAEPLANGYLQFFQNETAIPEPTYNDPEETILNPANVPLDGEGRLTLNVYGSVLYTVKKFNSVGVQKGSNDNVRPRGAADAVKGQLDLWDPAISYNTDDLVKADDGNYYQSLTDSNLNNNPSDPSIANWKRWSNVTVWNVNVTYPEGTVTQTSSGNLWKAVTVNAGNDPELDNGTNWLPAIDGEKVPEIVVIEQDIANLTTVIPHTGGGNLTANRTNELRDGGTYLLPLASSVLANQTIRVTLPDGFSSFQPIIQRSGADTISYSGGVDTEIQFISGSQDIELTSDGVSNWGL